MPSRLKKLMAKETADYLRDLHNVVLVDYRGLSAQESLGFRRALREKGVSIRVIRNRITVRALSELGNPDLGALIQGPTAVLGGDEPVLMARAAVEFAKQTNKLDIRGGFVDGQVCTADEIRAISKWPSRAEILAGIAAALLGTAGIVVAAALGPGRRLAGGIKARVADLEEGKGA